MQRVGSFWVHERAQCSTYFFRAKSSRWNIHVIFLLFEWFFLLLLPLFSSLVAYFPVEWNINATHDGIELKLLGVSCYDGIGNR